MSNQDLRERLREISECTKEERIAHPERVERLKKELSHSIRFIARGEVKSLCYDYALNIDAGLMVVVSTYCGFPVNNTFMTEFIASAVLPDLVPVSLNDAADGDLILYLHEGAPRHAGIMQAGRVISKWGNCPIYEHDLDEVPSSYGNEKRSFKMPDSHAMTVKLAKFATTKYPNLREPFGRALKKYLERRGDGQSIQES